MSNHVHRNSASDIRRIAGSFVSRIVVTVLNVIPFYIYKRKLFVDIYTGITVVYWLELLMYREIIREFREREW